MKFVEIRGLSQVFYSKDFPELEVLEGPNYKISKDNRDFVDWAFLKFLFLDE